MIKLIASDMDGTLLNSKHEISKENIDAIKKAQELGIHFAIATGRMYEDVKPFLEEHDLRSQCIVMNGAEYRDEDGKILRNIDIDKEKAIAIFQIINKYKISAQIYTRDGIYTISKKDEALIGMAYRLRAFEPGTPFEEAIKLASSERHFLNLKYVDDIDNLFSNGLNIAKIVLFYDNIDILKKIKEELKSLDELAISSSFPTNLEINNADAQKGNILSEVIKDMGIESNEVMVIGDSSNDYSMFEKFSVSFAMGNATPEIKEAAKYITDTNDNAGVAKAIYKAINLK
jgi:Cof subfamily protein (haloacid dehalogenase superfamily)